MFVVVSCFEVALRNRIDKVMKARWGNDRLRDFILPGGALYSDKRAENTKKIIEKEYYDLVKHHNYSHTKLLSEVGFGVWKYMFSNIQYLLTGHVLWKAFPNKPKSTKQHRYDNTYALEILSALTLPKPRTDITAL